MMDDDLTKAIFEAVSNMDAWPGKDGQIGAMVYNWDDPADEGRPSTLKEFLDGTYIHDEADDLLMRAAAVAAEVARRFNA